MHEQQTQASLLPDERLDEVNEQIKLIQKKQGLTFGTDAYLLSAFIRPQPHGNAVDLGSGTGIIPLLLCAKHKIQTITAVEIQPAFADLIRRNVTLNGFADRIIPLSADVRQLTASMLGGEVDLVCANPPYMKPNTGRGNRATEKDIARHEICGDISDFCAAASRVLRSKGRFACVFRPERLGELFSAMKQHRLEPKRMVMVHADAATPPSMVLVEALKDASEGLRVAPPFLLYELPQADEACRRMTPQATAVYQTCSFSEWMQANPNRKKKQNNI